MRLRSWGVAAVVVLAAATLAGCRTNVGAAATVNGHRISETTVNDYVTPAGAASSSAPASASSSDSTSTLVPKPQVLTTLVQEQLFQDTLTKNGGLPTAGQLSSVHDAAVSTILGQTTAGSAFDTSLKKILDDDGLRRSYFPRFIRALELEYTLVERLHLTNIGDVASAVTKAGGTVSVNPRYGTWDRSTLTVKTTGGRPGFLSLQPTRSASPSAQPVG